MHIFPSGSGSTGKSHFLKVRYNTISKTLLYHCQNPRKPTVLLLGSTWISVANIGRTTMNSGLEMKLRRNLLSLNDKYKAALKIW